VLLLYQHSDFSETVFLTFKQFGRVDFVESLGTPKNKKKKKKKQLKQA